MEFSGGFLQVQLRSHYTNDNQVIRVTLSALIMRPAAFTEPYWSGSTTLDAWCRECNYTRRYQSTQLSPSPIKAEWCMVSLYYIMGYSNGSTTPKGTVKHYNDFEITFTTDELYWAVFSIHCLL